MHFDFDAPVPHGGYHWWYVDAMSDDGCHALTLIAFVGSVFSPFYARARRRGPADPLQHCAVNVVLYGAGRKRWSLTERPGQAVRRSGDRLEIGPSRLDWDGTTLSIQVDEITVPFPSRLRGTIRVVPHRPAHRPFALDGEGRHRWNPIAPVARVELDFDRPQLHWSGPGYLDSNAGDRPLEDDFVGWHWSRISSGDSTLIAYDVERRHGGAHDLAVRVGADGHTSHPALPPQQLLATTGWRIPRSVRCEHGHAAAVARTLEDTPFYARSIVRTRLDGRDVEAMHESLSLDRFRTPWVQRLLPFRMGRARR
jgi:carotenoid 1,2-hydratase